MTHDFSEAFALERYLIPPDEWDDSGAPRAVMDIVTEETDAGVSAGIGYHPEKGWFVLESGQGPFIVWSTWTNTNGGDSARYGFWSPDLFRKWGGQRVRVKFAYSSLVVGQEGVVKDWSHGWPDVEMPDGRWVSVPLNHLEMVAR